MEADTKEYYPLLTVKQESIDQSFWCKPVILIHKEGIYSSDKDVPESSACSCEGSCGCSCSCGCA